MSNLTSDLWVILWLTLLKFVRNSFPSGRPIFGPWFTTVGGSMSHSRIAHNLRDGHEKKGRFPIVGFRKYYHFCLATLKEELNRRKAIEQLQPGWKFVLVYWCVCEMVARAVLQSVKVRFVSCIRFPLLPNTRPTVGRTSCSIILAQNVTLFL